MKLIIGSDHGGLKTKNFIVEALKKNGHEVTDIGCHTESSCDYPDFAKKVGLAVAQKKVERGILVCGSGIGMSIAANKVRGVRAAVVWNRQVAALASEHNHANVLCLSGRFVSAREALAMVNAWILTPRGGDRHARRIRKITAIEKNG